MQLTYVPFPAQIPNQISWGLVNRNTVFQSPGGDVSQVARTPLWKATLSFRNLDNGESAALRAFLAQLSRPARVFRLTDYGAKPRGSRAGNPVVSGANQTGGALITSGWTANAQGVLLAGDYVQLATGQLLTMDSDVNADASGVATLNLSPDIRTAPADGSPLTLTNPTCVMWMPQLAIPSTSPPIAADLSFDCVESLKV